MKVDLKWLLDFFRELEAAVPPKPTLHHGMHRALYGSDADGWEEKLAVTILHEGVFRNFFFEEADLQMAPANVAQEIARLMKDWPLEKSA